MSMNITSVGAANGVGAYSPASMRSGRNALQQLSTGFRIDTDPAKTAEPANAREAGTRTAALERAVRTVSQSVNVQSMSQNALNERNADLVQQRAQGGNVSPLPSVVGGNGQIDAYA